jgi:hypothetical protein
MPVLLISQCIAMIQTSMMDFVKVGGFGALQKGLPRNELQKLLGIPEMWGTQEKLAIADLWRYGNVEFHFYDHQVSFIFSDGDDLCAGGESWSIDPGIICKGLPLKEFTDILAEMGIQYITEQYRYDENQQIVTTSGGAIFSFVVNPERAADALGLFWWSSYQKLQ